LDWEAEKKFKRKDENFFVVQGTEKFPLTKSAGHSLDSKGSLDFRKGTPATRS